MTRILGNSRRVESVRSHARAMVVLAISAAFLLGWTPFLPVAGAIQLTPAELIQAKLPANKTIATASDAQLLQAVYRSVKQALRESSRKDTALQEAALIVRTAAGARRSLAPDLLCIASRGVQESGSLNCSWVSGIVEDWITEDPHDAGHLTSVMSECTSACREALKTLPHRQQPKYVFPPSNINLLPGSSAMGRVGAETCVVCQNGNNIEVTCSDVDSYVNSHPGATAGACQTTPTRNR